MHVPICMCVCVCYLLTQKKMSGCKTHKRKWTEMDECRNPAVYNFQSEYLASLVFIRVTLWSSESATLVDQWMKESIFHLKEKVNRWTCFGRLLLQNESKNCLSELRNNYSCAQYQPCAASIRTCTELIGLQHHLQNCHFKTLTATLSWEPATTYSSSVKGLNSAGSSGYCCQHEQYSSQYLNNNISTNKIN